MGKERTEVQKISPSKTKQTIGNENELIKDALCLWEEKTLSSGRTVIPFSFTVPEKLPPSFEGEYGFIRYQLRLRVVRPTPFIDQFVTRPLSITPIYDLKSLPYTSYRTRRVINEKREKILKNGYLKAIININKSGFVCGEKVDILVDINNESPAIIRGIKGVLRQHITYFSYDECEPKTRIKIAQCSYNIIEFDQRYEVSPKERSIYRGKSPQLPPVSPSIRRKRIHIDYDIQFEIYLEQCPSAFASIPIIIGNVPCNHSVDPPTVAFHRLDRLTPPSPSSVTSILSK
ncbi:unnamed protein product [Bursaphelenchus xylophilus]|uniref:(pine wood nematode) hypothetical protein n=1 Tax=Bursaphelenchus xylophilus TaxID=6326 RepID=A0A7I8WJT4_BURXY|nr:unnamed protein product [Bursaphelenchus xylophilus]CAG9107609.1 unnamed protein product [Bursaphelenchus xylophilus]